MIVYLKELFTQPFYNINNSHFSLFSLQQKQNQLIPHLSDNPTHYQIAII